MTINFLIILVIIALGAWLGNVLLSLEAIVGQSRTRVKAARESASRLESTLKRLQREEEGVNKETDELLTEMIGLRKKQAEVQVRLSEEQGKRRPRLLILSDRRNPGDKEWLVTVTNTQIREVDGSHPLAAEWARGREYLVWAETDRDASERALRRFSARPGYSVRGVTAVKEDLYPSGRGGSKPSQSAG
jgi:septal ring factor EnvC (AmiA/AmiB activator)